MGFDVKKHFLDRIQKSDTCWTLKGSNSGDYSTLGNGERAHRFSYRHFKGDFDPKLFVCHHCDNPPCINPDHLFVGTCQDNMTDLKNKNKLKKEKEKQRKIDKLKEPIDYSKWTYLSFDQILKFYPFTLPMMRRYMLNRDSNGLSNCVRKIGNRMIFNRALFEAWIESKGEK